MDILARISLVAFIVAAMTGSAFADDNTHAGRAVTEALQSSGHASTSVAHAIAASGQVTSAVMAVPFSVGGAVFGLVGAVSAGAAHDLMRAATAPIGTPLAVTDEVISVILPNEALRRSDKSAKP